MTTMAMVGLLAAGGIVLAGCGARAGGDAAARTPERDRITRASQGLCEALRASTQRRVEDAAILFERETHDFLHELADVAMDADREAAAGLLEAKQRVEAALEDPAAAEPSDVARRLTALHQAMRQAAEAVGLDAPLCPEEAA